MASAIERALVKLDAILAAAGSSAPAAGASKPLAVRAAGEVVPVAESQQQHVPIVKPVPYAVVIMSERTG
jgi:hypothetical protein